jgi:aspartyl/asparaginyl-tRNA synthetase
MAARASSSRVQSDILIQRTRIQRQITEAQKKIAGYGDRVKRLTRAKKFDEVKKNMEILKIEQQRILRCENVLKIFSTVSDMSDFAEISMLLRRADGILKQNSKTLGSFDTILSGMQENTSGSEDSKNFEVSEEELAKKYMTSEELQEYQQYLEQNK